MTHHGSVFRASPFYHRLLEDGFAGRFVMPGAAVDATELRVHLGRLLPSYMVPASFATLPRLPRTASGKVDRKRLAATAAAEPRRPTAFTPPRTEIERTIAAVWQQVLGIAHIGRDDNFFDLGGHSLLLVQVHATLVEQLGRTLPVTDLFQFPTIHSLAAHLGGRSEPGAPDAPPLASRRMARGRRERPTRSRSSAWPDGSPARPDLDAFWANLRDGVESI